ncbi:hypothetical protein EUGRSUZ_L02080 [Eucalyptus grandis]|uniref:AB hydrolase-1 domain-containing protein n=1 Tax=Eucalyptus grandis TaxID=71139 RepID=A0A058ZTV0_EUCGR|nr:hypothetical protein EUGRSUZ_L02080 [Eucalyptus grandis]
MSESLCSSGGIFQAPHGRVHGNRMPTLVPSHGFTADQTVWHDVVPFFACFFKVVVYDLAFVHQSGHLKLKRSICVGHSMSAVIGCLAAIRRPDLFKRLVRLSGSPRYLNAKGYTGGFDEPAIGLDTPMNACKLLGNNMSALTEFEHSLGRIEPEIAVTVAEILSDLKWALLEVLVPRSVVQSRKDVVVRHRSFIA